MTQEQHTYTPPDTTAGDHVPAAVAGYLDGEDLARQDASSAPVYRRRGRLAARRPAQCGRDLDSSRWTVPLRHLRGVRHRHQSRPRRTYHPYPVARRRHVRAAHARASAAVVGGGAASFVRGARRAGTRAQRALRRCDDRRHLQRCTTRRPCSHAGSARSRRCGRHHDHHCPTGRCQPDRDQSPVAARLPRRAGAAPAARAHP